MSARPSRAVRVAAAAANVDALAFEVAERARPTGEAIVEIRAAGVNPSDVKAMLGAMPQAVWPRTPGRDFAGVVVDGPAGTVGREVWGSSGELGIRRDGSHAAHLALDAACLFDKPARLSFREAGSVGVPFVTAAQGFAEAGGVLPTDVVLVLGANGKVGQAAVQIAARAGARVIAVARGPAYGGFASAPVAYIDAKTVDDIAARVRELSGGHGPDHAINVVGSPYFDAANRCLAKLGRQMFISTLDRAVPFDIMAFYRGRHRFIGVDSLGLGTAESCALLDTLKSGFEDGTLKPFTFAARAACGFDGMGEAYRAVLGGEAGRVVLEPAA